jgi:dethiobiotin synthetase
MRQTIFITGTDTGVGKTVLTALLARHLREQGLNAAALKPVSAGGRDDARALRAATDDALTLDEINPWHFRAAIAPLSAARRERRRVRLAEVLAHLRAMQKRFDVVLVEGAGGLLSPLGEDFDSRDLLTALRAKPVVVGSSRIGVVNQMLLTLGALPRVVAAGARIVLMSPPKPDALTRTNARLLAELSVTKRIFELPWLGGWPLAREVPVDLRVQRTLHALVK